MLNLFGIDMKRTLHLLFVAVAITWLSSSQLPGQSLVFSEDFSGFTTGTHSSPSTYDQSESLDTKTYEPGWTGYKVYSAGGEIKIGTASVNGWITTPLVDLTGLTGTAILRFDISRWPDDATIVQVYLNGASLGDPLEPTDEFQTVELSLADAGSSCSIKFESLSKRFYLDNIQISDENVTYITNYDQSQTLIRIYPNPASAFICFENLTGYNKLDIYNITGSLIRTYQTGDRDKLQIGLSGIPAGIYIIRFTGFQGVFTSRIIKYE